MDFNDKLFDFLVATDQLDNFLGKNSKDKEKKEILKLKQLIYKKKMLLILNKIKKTRKNRRTLVLRIKVFLCKGNNKKTRKYYPS